jgi:hypothetical protein
VFKIDFFSNLFSPFLALVLGSLLAEIPSGRGTRAATAVAVLALLTALAVANRAAVNKTEGYFGGVANLLNTLALPGDTVWVPQKAIFWGVLWYKIGPGWGSPVTITAPLRPQSRWLKLFGFLGPQWTRRLDLMPKGQSVTTADNITVLTASESEAEAGRAQRLWVVTYAGRSDEPPAARQDTLNGLKKNQSFSFPPLRVSLFERAAP